MSEPHTPLAAGFEARGSSDHAALLEKDLEGADPAGLVTRTADGLAIRPLYTEGEFLRAGDRARDPAERLAVIGSESNGRLLESIDHALDHGATGVLLKLSAPGRVEGLAAEPADWAEVLADAADGPLHLRATADALAHARAWLEAPGLATRPGCSLGIDPFAVAARTGRFDELEDALSGAARLAAEALNHPARPRAFVLDSEVYDAAGATTGQAVGALLAALVQSLRALEQASVDPARALPALGLCLRLDSRFFEQIAALRALRLLHGQVARACGVDDPSPLHLTALPAPRILSRRDPWVNILRQTATSFAALCGQADAVGTFAWDTLLEQGSVTARRVARNTPVILAEESRLGLVGDPAAGSWFLDELTRGIASVAWDFFRRIEAEGGLVATMRSGWLLARLEESGARRRERLARRDLARTGVSEFARLDEELPAPVTPLPVPPKGAWPRHGDDDDFERLRAAADRQARKTRRPRVFLARFGESARTVARETWLAHLAAAGGIESIAGSDDGDPAREFASSRATVAILCADDAALAARGAAVAEGLSAHGRVWAAGRPSAALEAAGVERFVHAGVDAVEVLTELLDAEGVQP